MYMFSFSPMQNKESCNKAERVKRWWRYTSSAIFNKMLTKQAQPGVNQNEVQSNLHLAATELETIVATHTHPMDVNSSPSIDLHSQARLSVAKFEDIAAHLKAAHAAGQRTQRRVCIALIAFAFPITLTCIVAGVADYLGGLSAGFLAYQSDRGAEATAFARSFFFLAPTPLSITMGLLACYPTNSPMIRALNEAAQQQTLVVGSLLILILVQVARGLGTTGYCAEKPHACPVWIAFLSVSVTSIFALHLRLVALGRKRPEAPAKCSSEFRRLIHESMRAYREEYGTWAFIATFVCVGFPGTTASYWLEQSFGRDEYFAVPPRACLQSTWVAIRCFAFVTGVNLIINAYLSFSFESFRELQRTAFAGEMVFGASFLLFMGVLPSSTNRGLVVAWLAKVAQTPEERTASGVGALIGNRSSTRVFDAAQKSFCAVDWTAIRATGIGERSRTPHSLNRSTAGGVATAISTTRRALQKLAEPAELGECDVFVCHSHFDSALEKLDALENWADTFEETHGKTPLLWIGVPTCVSVALLVCVCARVRACVSTTRMRMRPSDSLVLARPLEVLIVGCNAQMRRASTSSVSSRASPSSLSALRARSSFSCCLAPA